MERISRWNEQPVIAATIGQPVAPLICGIYEHYEEHAREFEQLSA